MHSVENMGFLITSLFLGAIAVTIGILNLYYFNKIRLNPCGTISQNTATGMIIASIILLILAVIILTWGLFRLFMPHDVPESSVNKEYNTYIHNEPTTQTI